MTHSRDILLVEDDHDVADAIRDVLEDAGYNVSVAGNGAAAMQHLNATTALPGLIFLDLMMPVMDGEHFWKEISKEPRFAALPVVLLTAVGDAPGKAVELAVRGGLRKPVHLKELLETAEKYCGIA